LTKGKEEKEKPKTYITCCIDKIEPLTKKIKWSIYVYNEPNRKISRLDRIDNRTQTKLTRPGVNKDKGGKKNQPVVTFFFFLYILFFE
jgi:hypothetical protein